MKGLTDYRKFLVLRPLPPNTETDEFGNPVLKKDDYSNIDWDDVKFTSYSNIASIKRNKNKYIAFLFHYDNVLERMWNDPFKFLSKISGFLLMQTPDFSTYINMNRKEIEHNVFKARWMGAWAQYFHYRLLITGVWGGPETYDLCFSGFPKGVPIVISTVGCLKCKDAFLHGFNEMKKRINPSLIIVRGPLIEGMTGNFLFVDFKDTFNINQDVEQLTLFNLSKIITIKEVD